MNRRQSDFTNIQMTSVHAAKENGSATSAPSVNPRRGRVAIAKRLQSGFVNFCVPGILSPKRLPLGMGSVDRQQSLKGGKVAKVKSSRTIGFSIGSSLGGLVDAMVDLVSIALVVVGEDDAPRPAKAQVIRLKGAVRPKPRLRRARAILLAAVATVAPKSVAAQAVHRDSTPTDLFVPETGNGIRLSPGFVLYPSLDTSVDYDSNIYNVDTNKRSDAVFRIQPEALIASDFARHSLQLRAGAILRRFASDTAENADEYHASARATFELGNSTNIVPELGYSRGFEQRGTAGDQFLTDSPITYHRSYAAISIERDRGVLGARANGQITGLSYDDASVGGVPVDLSYRDVTVSQASLRIFYHTSPTVRAFVEGGVNAVDYRIAASKQRNSNGYSVLGGIHLQPSEQLNFEAAAGYMHQSFDNPSFSPVSAANYRLTADWTPRRTWNLKAVVRRDVAPSPRNDVPAIIRSQYQLGVQHSMGNRVLVEASAAAVEDNYRGIARTDRFYRAGVAARYRVNTRVGLSAQAGLRTQNGGRRFSGSYAGIGMRIAL